MSGEYGASETGGATATESAMGTRESAGASAADAACSSVTGNVVGARSVAAAQSAGAAADAADVGNVACASDSASARDAAAQRDSAGPTAAFRALHAELARGYGGAGDPDDPDLVQAMQMVLHLPKVDPPARSAVLAAAAAAAVAVCLDERAGSDGPWQARYLAWKRARIRKVARRARGAQWAAVQEVDGVTVDHGGAQARALVPSAVEAVDPRIRRLQIGGTDLDHDEPGPPDPDRPVLWVDPRLGMTVGKAAAQVGHASMLLAGALRLEDAWEWARAGFACSVRDADPRQWAALTERVAAGAAVAVRDAGFTEIAPGSLTVIAVPPRAPVP